MWLRAQVRSIHMVSQRLEDFHLPYCLSLFLLLCLIRNYFTYTLFSEVIVTFPTSASMFSTTQQKPVFPGRLRSLSKAPCGGFL